MKDLFPTKDDKEMAAANFKNLLRHPGWKQVEMILDYNIEVVRKQLEEGVSGETKEDIERRRSNLKLQQELKNLPMKQIKELASVESVSPEHDPYSTAEEIREERKFDK